MTRKLLLAALLLLPACSATTPTATPQPAPAPLAYALPGETTAAYAFTDSSSFDIEAGGLGQIHVTIGSAGLADVKFASQGTDLQATIQITKYAGSMTNSQMGGGPTVTEADAQGVAVVTVTPRGAATVVTMPKLSTAAQQVGLSEGFFRRFFVRLPAAAAKTGTVWTDTVATTDDNAGAKATVTDIVTSTLVGDSVVNGRTLAHITTATKRTLIVSGTSQGMQIAQRLSGTASGSLLWDRERKLLVDHREHTELAGTFDLPQMGVAGLPVTARANGHLSLR